MPAINYKTTTVSTKPAKRNKGGIPDTGIVVPTLRNLNTGIHAIQQIEGGPRYKLWYHVDGKKRYVSLPKGISLTEARHRRDNLFRNLREKYAAKRRTPRNRENGGRKVPELTQHTFIYRVPATYGIRIRGRKVGKARTKYEAEQIRDRWIADNADKVPDLATAGKVIVTSRKRRKTP